MTLFLQALIGAIMWAFANLLYIDLKRKGVRGFARVVAFWMGAPATWISIIAVSEGTRTRPPPDDDEALLAEIRRDRALRSGGERTPGSEPAAGGTEGHDPGEPGGTETI